MSNAVEMPLTFGQVALVDEDDVWWLSKYRWYAQWQPRAKAYYAATCILSKRGYRPLLMHRLLLGLGLGDKRLADHVNRKTLDNRRENLRVCTSAQNHINSKVWGNNKTGFKGVIWVEKRQVFQAWITVERKPLYLGQFATAPEATAAYRRAAIKHYKEFGKVKSV